MTSAGHAAVRSRTLIVDLPAQPKAIAECLETVHPATPHCVELIGGAWFTTKPKRRPALGPKNARRSPP